MTRRSWHPRYFIASFIALALVVMGIRLENLADSLFYGQPVKTIPAATAEDEPSKPAETPAEKPAAKEQEKAGGKAADKADKGEAKTETKPAETAHVAPPPEDLSEGEMEVLKQLAKRRALLDQREQEIIQKSAILQAAELRVDQKVKDMEKLRTQLQGMLGQLSEEEQTQIDNLVKMYEIMKPKEAARIMQTIDMPVLLRVMKQMKPAKSAPVLAEMEAAKAKEITMSLAAQHALPDTRVLNNPKIPNSSLPIPPAPSPPGK